jgi:signal transduction histidine kinase
MVPSLVVALSPYRVTGELLRNAVRHASARTVRVTVESGAGTVRLTVTDDGTGFDPTAPEPNGHIGLRIARQLLADHNGTLSITSTPEGTVASVVVPDHA